MCGIAAVCVLGKLVTGVTHMSPTLRLSEKQLKAGTALARACNVCVLLNLSSRHRNETWRRTWGRVGGYVQGTRHEERNVNWGIRNRDEFAVCMISFYLTFAGIVVYKTTASCHVIICAINIVYLLFTNSIITHPPRRHTNHTILSSSVQRSKSLLSHWVMNRGYCGPILQQCRYVDL